MKLLSIYKYSIFLSGVTVGVDQMCVLLSLC